MALTVKELKEVISKLPDDMRVFVQKDSEGNGFAEAHYADPDGVLVIDEYHAEVYNAEWSSDEADMDEDEWQDYLEKPRVLVIAP